MAWERDLIGRVNRPLILSNRVMLLLSRSHPVSSTEGNCWKVRESHYRYCDVEERGLESQKPIQCPQTVALLRRSANFLLPTAEDNMNVQLKDITVTARDGRVSHLDQVYIRGSHVRFFIVPDMLRYVEPTCAIG